MDSHESELLLKLIIQSLEQLDERLAGAAEKNHKAIEDLDTKVNGICITMSRNTESLEEHMARTVLLEESLKPVRSIYDWATISGKGIAILALLVTIIGGLFKTFIFLLGVK